MCEGEKWYRPHYDGSMIHWCGWWTQFDIQLGVVSRGRGGCDIQLWILAVSRLDCSSEMPRIAFTVQKIAALISPQKYCTSLLWLYFPSLSFANCPLLYLPFLKKSFSEWVIFFRDCTSSGGARPRWLSLSSFPLPPSLINLFLVVLLSPFLLTLCVSLIATLFSVTHCLSSILLVFFFFKFRASVRYFATTRS